MAIDRLCAPDGEPVLAIAMSADGGLIAFATRSVATGQGGIYLHDRPSRRTIRVVQAPAHSLALSPDGHFLAFASAGLSQTVGYVAVEREPLASTVLEVPPALAQITADNLILSVGASHEGRLVAFDATSRPELTPGDDPGTFTFLHRRSENHVSLAVDAGGSGSAARMFPTVSADGTFVFLAEYRSTQPAGAFIAYEVAVEEAKVLTGASGSKSVGHSAVSSDGRVLAFESGDGIEIYDLATNSSTPLLGPSGRPIRGATPDLSGEGNILVYSSYWRPGDGVRMDGMGVYVHDRDAGTFHRVDVAPNGDVANGSSQFPLLSDDGRFVAFISKASNLMADHQGLVDCVYVATMSDT